MESILTVSIVVITVVSIAAVALDFVAGLVSLWKKCSMNVGSDMIAALPPQEELAYLSASETEILPVFPQPQAFETPVVEDLWLTSAVATTEHTCCCHATEIATHQPLLLLAPAIVTSTNLPEDQAATLQWLEVTIFPQAEEMKAPIAPAPGEQVANAYFNWSIRELKREASKRKIKAYSSLSKAELISRLTA